MRSLRCRRPVSSSATSGCSASTRCCVRRDEGRDYKALLATSWSTWLSPTALQRQLREHGQGQAARQEPRDPHDNLAMASQASGTGLQQHPGRDQGRCLIAMSSSELDTLQAAFRGAGKLSTSSSGPRHVHAGPGRLPAPYEPILYGWRDGTDHFWCGARDRVMSGDQEPHKNDLHPT